jgi:aldehyde dehydrogenase (NAD+)
MKVWREEVFGPVMTLTKFKTLDEVVQRANDSPYGLACGIFTKDARKGNELSRRIRAGLVFWNCYHVVDVAAPFGTYHIISCHIISPSILHIPSHYHNALIMLCCQ